METNEKIVMNQSKTRSGIAIMLVMTLCIAPFALPDFQELIIGGLIGSVSSALVFYFKKEE